MNREHISQAELAGRLGQKPELDETVDGVRFARLNIATSERYTDRSSGQIREKTEWTRAVAWGDLAESIASRFDKGSPIVLAGAMRVNSYEKDGAKNRVLELHVDSAEPNLEAGTSRNRGPTGRGCAQHRAQDARQRDCHDRSQRRGHHQAERQGSGGLAQRHPLGTHRRERGEADRGWRSHLRQWVDPPPQRSRPRGRRTPPIRHRRPPVPGPRAGKRAPPRLPAA